MSKVHDKSACSTEFVLVFIRLAVVVRRFVKDDVLAMYPRAQSAFSVTRATLALPHVLVLFARELVGQ